MASIFDTVNKYMKNQSEAIKKVDSGDAPKAAPPKKAAGLPDTPKKASISGDIKESERAVEELRKKGWIK